MTSSHSKGQPGESWDVLKEILTSLIPSGLFGGVASATAAAAEAKQIAAVAGSDAAGASADHNNDNGDGNGGEAKDGIVGGARGEQVPVEVNKTTDNDNDEEEDDDEFETPPSTPLGLRRGDSFSTPASTPDLANPPSVHNDDNGGGIDGIDGSGGSGGGCAGDGAESAAAAVPPSEEGSGAEAQVTMAHGGGGGKGKGKESDSYFEFQEVDRGDVVFQTLYETSEEEQSDMLGAQAAAEEKAAAATAVAAEAAAAAQAAVAAHNSYIEEAAQRALEESGLAPNETPVPVIVMEALNMEEEEEEEGGEGEKNDADNASNDAGTAAAADTGGGRGATGSSSGGDASSPPLPSSSALSRGEFPTLHAANPMTPNTAAATMSRAVAAAEKALLSTGRAGVAAAIAGGDGSGGNQLPQRNERDARGSTTSDEDAGYIFPAVSPKRPVKQAAAAALGGSGASVLAAAIEAGHDIPTDVLKALGVDVTAVTAPADQTPSPRVKEQRRRRQPDHSASGLPPEGFAGTPPPDFAGSRSSISDSDQEDERHSTSDVELQSRGAGAAHGSGDDVIASSSSSSRAESPMTPRPRVVSDPFDDW